jgi:hypothetical protein
MACRVTPVPLPKLALHVVPQLMPAGLDATRPAPVPPLLTVRVYVCAVNVAVTLRAAVMLTVQVALVPEHAPLQPVKVAPGAGAAVRVTEVPDEYEALQVLPQAIPLGAEVTVPLPVPLLLRVRV